MQNQQLTLEKVANILASWRATKPKPQTRIPQYIKNHIRSISKNYPHQQISKTLNLYGRKLTSILNSTQQQQTKQFNFVEIPTTTNLITTNCTIKHPNGSILSINVANQTLLEIIKSFIYAPINTSI